MDPLSVLWEQQVGRTKVYETEHMFGFDLICATEVDGRWYPRAIISRSRRLNGLERMWAARWCAATDREDYGVAVTYMQNLQEVFQKD